MRDLDAEDRRRILALLSAGRKIEAIKLARERAQTDLKSAKERVEAMEAELAPGQRRRSGCLSLFALAALGLGT